MAIKYARLGGAAAVATVAAMVFAACGDGATVTEPPAAPVPPVAEVPGDVVVPEPVAPVAPGQCEGLSGTINFRWWGTEGRTEITNEAIAAFQEANPDVVFNVQPGSFDGQLVGLTAEAVADTLPDVFQSNVEWISIFANAGRLRNLSASPYVDLAPIADSLSEVTIDGNVYALPTGLNAASLLVNLDIFEEAGIPIPDDTTWSWEDLQNIAQQISDAGLTNDQGQPIFGLSHLGGQQVARVWANQQDGGMFGADGNVNWSEESIADYLQLVQELEASGATPPASLQAEAGVLNPGESLMALNQSALQPQWSNQLNAIATASGANIGLLRFPGDATEAHVGTWLRPSLTFAVAHNAQSPEAAECFVNFMVNSPEAAEILQIDRGIPLNPDRFDQIVPNLEGPNAAQADFIERITANPGLSTPVPQIDGDLNAIILTPTDAVLFGQATPEQSAATLRSELQASIAQ